MNTNEHEMQTIEHSTGEIRPWIRALCMIPCLIGVLALALSIALIGVIPAPGLVVLVLGAAGLIVQFGWIMIRGQAPPWGLC